MASFLPGVTDQFPQQQLYTPDYNFLSQVYNVAQGQYERGFQAVRSMMNSTFASQMSNPENNMRRDDIFKKLNDQIRSIAGLDLSKASNLEKARKVFDPILQDQEIMYDIGFTKKYQQESQRGEMLRTSNDPEQRAKYNPYAVEYLQNSLKEMSRAKRGDGSIMSVTPREFVAFEDWDKALSDMFKAEGLEVTSSRISGDGYILELTNGEQAVVPFQEWAKFKLSDPKYMKQFEVMGTVQLERQLDGFMSQGMSKEQATGILADSIRDQVLERKSIQGYEYQKEIAKVDQAIDVFKRTYPKGETTNPAVVQSLEQLKQRRAAYDQGLTRIKQEVLELSNSDTSALARQLPAIFAEQNVQQAADQFGKLKALTNIKQKTSSDATTLKQWDLQMQRMKLMEEMRQFEVREANAMTRAAMSYKAQTMGKKGNAGEGDMELLGLYTSADQTRTGLDVILDGTENSLTEATSTSIDEGGLLQYIIGTDAHTENYSALNKIKSLASGQPVTWTEDDIDKLEYIGEQLDVVVKAPSNKGEANSMLMNIIEGTYKKTADAINNDKTDKKITNSKEALALQNKLFASMTKFIERSKVVEAELEKTTEVISNPDGSLKSMYKDAEFMGYSANGTPLFDLRKLPQHAKEQISAVLGPEFSSQSRVSGESYTLPNPSAAEIVNAFNPNVASRIVINGKDVTTNIMKGKSNDVFDAITGQPISVIQETFGEIAKVNFDPASETAELVFNVDATSPLSKVFSDLKAKNNEIRVSIPYGKLYANPSLKRLATSAAALTSTPGALGLTASFANDPYQESVVLPRHIEAAGFSGRLQGMNSANGGYGIKLTGTFISPDKREIKINRFYPATPGDVKSLQSVESGIMDDFNTYLNARMGAERNNNTNTGEVYQLNY